MFEEMEFCGERGGVYPLVCYEGPVENRLIGWVRECVDSGLIRGVDRVLVRWLVGWVDRVG